MNLQKNRAFAPLAAVTFLLVFAVFIGCEKKQEAPVPEASATNYVSRTRDPEYHRELQGVIDRKTQTAKTQAQLMKNMALLAERARKALPEGATEEQVKAELDANPAKYPGWKTLSAEFAKVNATAEKELADARRIVQRRIMKETADREAAAAKKGEATAKQPVVSK